MSNRSDLICDSLKERLLLGIRVDRNRGCWIWTRSTTGKGYGVFSFKGRRKKAHHAAYEVFKGPIPSGSHLCHHCDNKLCCNPEHLYVGNQSTNMRDMYNRGRGGPPHTPGEKNGRAKLTEAAVREIRVSLESYKVLANKYGVTTDTIRNAMFGKTWKHIQGGK